MLLSWLIMGKIYPVIERPSNDPIDKDKTLLGKGCQMGFDSHYVITKKTTGMPCPINQEPDGDELILFSKNQILPRYLIYYSQKKNQSQNTTQKSSTELKTSNSKIFILIWLSDILSANETVLRSASSLLPSLIITQVTSLEEAKVWISKNKDLLSSVSSKRVRMITNMHREYDGKDHAGELSIVWFKSEKMFKNSAVMLFETLHDITRVDYLHKPDKKTYITSNPVNAIEFATFKN